MLWTLGYINVDYSVATGTSASSSTTQPQPAEQTATPEPTIEPTMAPTQESMSVHVMESTVDDTTIKRESNTPYIVVGLAVIIVIGIGAVIIVKKKRK